MAAARRMYQLIMHLREGRNETTPAQPLGVVMAAATTPAADRPVPPLDEQPFLGDHLGLFRRVHTGAAVPRAAVLFVLPVGVRTARVGATLQLDVAHEHALLGQQDQPVE